MKLIPITLWGAIVGLDTTALLQTMVSRPLIAALGIGLLTGRQEEALVIGIILELFALPILPVGATRYPDSGVGAVVATASYSLGTIPGPDPGALALAVVIGLIWEWISGRTVEVMRRVNALLISRRGEGDLAARVESAHLRALTLEGLRAALLTLGGTLIGMVLISRMSSYWTLPGHLTVGGLTVVGMSLLGVVLTLFPHSATRRRVFLIGLLCGSISLILL